MIAFLIISLICILIIFEKDTLVKQDIEMLCRIASTIMIITLFFLIISTRKGTWSLSTVFAFSYCIFHFGLIIINSVNLNLSIEFREYINKWWFNESNGYAIILVIIGITSFASGTILTIPFCSRVKEKKEENYIIEKVVLLTGFWLLVISVSIWFYDIFSKGGFSLLTGSYHDYIENDSTNFLDGYHLHFGSLGLIFLAISKPGKLRNLGLAVFATFAIFALPLGIRGRVLFPALTAIAIVGMKKVPIPITKTLIFGLFILCAITVFRQIRQIGLAETEINQLSFRPLEGLAEMGSSLRPVTETVKIVRKGEALLYGASYWAPFDRSLVYLIPGWTRPPVAEDDRFLARSMSKNVGPIGFSIIAEAYMNFGVTGVFAFMFIIGLLFGKMDMWTPNIINQMKAGAIMLPLMVQIRNSFIFVPVSILIGLLIVYLIYWFSKLQNSKFNSKLKESSL
jgi:oligosaccharide repeat unit polymerase